MSGWWYQLTHLSIFQDGWNHQAAWHCQEMENIFGLRIGEPWDVQKRDVCWLMVLFHDLMQILSNIFRVFNMFDINGYWLYMIHKLCLVITIRYDII